MTTNTSQPGPGITLLDGGTGRELKRIGAPFRQPEWSALALIEGPDFVRRVHDAFIEAGAGVITTNSYAVVPFHLGERRFAADGHALAALAGELARGAADAAGRAVRVAGSLPPIAGSYRADRFDASRARPVLDTLIAALGPSADLWLAETLSSVAEAELVRRVLGDDPRPLWLSFTLRDAPIIVGEPRLRSGERVELAVSAARGLGAEALLFNCSQPEAMSDAIRVASRSLSDTPGPALRLGAYANAFAPQGALAEANAELDEIRTDLTPEGYARFVRSWLADGATIVGGCCGIGPDHIRRLCSHDMSLNSDVHAGS